MFLPFNTAPVNDLTGLKINKRLQTTDCTFRLKEKTCCQDPDAQQTIFGGVVVRGPFTKQTHISVRANTSRCKTSCGNANVT